MNDIRQQLIDRASASMSQYPQYKGQFDRYVLCRVKRTIKTKRGVAFTKGEVTICDPDNFPDVGLAEMCNHRSVWSFTNKCGTLLDNSDLELL